MAILDSDIKYKYSGGSGNASGAASLGGVISTTDAPTGAGLFDNVSSAEAVAGTTEYRCIYVKNEHGSLTYTSPIKVWIQTNTPSANTTIEIALGTAAVSATEQTIANETTAPTGTTFSAPSSEGAGLTIPDLAPGAYKAVWIKRIVTAGAAAAADSFTIRVKGDSPP